MASVPTLKMHAPFVTDYFFSVLIVVYRVLKKNYDGIETYLRLLKCSTLRGHILWRSQLCLEDEVPSMPLGSYFLMFVNGLFNLVR